MAPPAGDYAAGQYVSLSANGRNQAESVHLVNNCALSTEEKLAALYDDITSVLRDTPIRIAKINGAVHSAD